MPSEKNLQELFHDTLKDIYFAEKKILSTLPKMWPAPGSANTELGVLMEPEVCQGETEVYTGVQA